MEDMNIQQLVEIVGGHLKLAAMSPLGGLWEPVGRVVTRVEQLSPGDVLLVLEDYRQAEPDCLTRAFDRGALGIIASGNVIEPWGGRFSIAVDDAQWSLWQLARQSRMNFGGKIITVDGGSSSAVISAMIRSVLKCENVPSKILGESIPEQLLGLKASSAYEVLEISSTKQGNLKETAPLCHADALVVASSQQAVFSNSCCNTHQLGPLTRELLESLPQQGVAAIDGQTSKQLGELRLPCPFITFGRDAGHDVAAHCVMSGQGRLAFAVAGQVAHLPAWGRHHLHSALAAWSVGRWVGLSDAEIASRLQQCQLPRHHCEVSKLAGLLWIDDTGRTSWESTQTALELLHSVDATGKRSVILGDAWEHLDSALAERLGALLVSVGSADQLFTIGKHASQFIAGATSAGMPAKQCFLSKSADHLLPQVARFSNSGDTVLMKGIVDTEVDLLLGQFESQPRQRAA